MINITKEQYKQYRQEDVRAFYKQNLQGKLIANPTLGKILFTQKGLGETIHRTPRYLHPFICILRELVETGTCDALLEPLYKPRKDRIIGFYKIKNTIKLLYLTITVTILIAQDQDGRKYYMFKKDPKGDLGEDKSSQRGPNESINIIHDLDTFVKGAKFFLGDCITIEINANNINEDNMKSKAIKTIAYHGTNKKFDAFSAEFTGKGNDQLGSGFYFTDSVDLARYYGDIIIKAEITLKNPLYVKGENLNGVHLTQQQAYEIIKLAPDVYDLDETTVWDFMDLSGYDEVEDYMLYDIAGKYVGYPIFSLEHDFYRDNATAFREACEKVLGYDGIIQKTQKGDMVYVVWFPESIKILNGNIAENIYQYLNAQLRSLYD